MAKKLRLIVDMDGVLANVYKQFKKYELDDTGIEIQLKDLDGLKEFEAFPNGKKHVRQRGFFKTVEVMPDAIEVLEKLNNNYDLYIVSSAMEFPQSLEEKFYWLGEHFPYITWKQIVLCGSKKVIDGDIMIDDHFKNLDHFEGRTLLFHQPHNAKDNNHSHERIKSWKEIEAILL